MFSLTLNCYLSSSHSKIVVNFVRKRHPTFERLIHVPSEPGRIGVFNLNFPKRPEFLLKKLQSGTLTCGLKVKIGILRNLKYRKFMVSLPFAYGNTDVDQTIVWKVCSVCSKLNV